MFTNALNLPAFSEYDSADPVGPYVFGNIYNLRTVADHLIRYLNLICRIGRPLHGVCANLDCQRLIRKARGGRDYCQTAACLNAYKRAYHQWYTAGKADKIKFPKWPGLKEWQEHDRSKSSLNA